MTIKKNILSRLSFFPPTENKKLELTSGEIISLNFLFLASASLQGTKELIEISLDKTVGTRQNDRNLTQAVLATVLGVVTTLKLIESPTNTLAAIYLAGIFLFWGGLYYSITKLKTMMPINRVDEFNKNYRSTLNRGLLFYQAVIEAINNDREHPKLECLRETIIAELN